MGPYAPDAHHRLSAAKQCVFTVGLIGYLQHAESNPVCCALGDIPTYSSPGLPVDLSFEYLISYIFSVRFDADYKVGPALQKAQI